jgi:hypothetical protein
VGVSLGAWLRGVHVGPDKYGNRYYWLKNDKPQRFATGLISRIRDKFLKITVI